MCVPIIYVYIYIFYILTLLLILYLVFGYLLVILNFFTLCILSLIQYLLLLLSYLMFVSDCSTYSPLLFACTSLSCMEYASYMGSLIPTVYIIGDFYNTRVIWIFHTDLIENMIYMLLAIHFIFANCILSNFRLWQTVKGCASPSYLVISVPWDHRSL